MIYGSVCSGIEAATVAWHPLGWKPAFFSEIENFPRECLKYHYPDVPLHGRDRKRGEDLEEYAQVAGFQTIGEKDYGTIDLLVGGTPCQSFSIAGLRGGLDDDRGNLTLEYLRLAERKGARWLVWENVPGVLSSNGGRDFGSILGGLQELGYGFAYRILDAQFFGVPQRRRRVFLVGYLGDWRPPAAVLFERKSLRRHPAPSRKKGQEVAATLRRRASFDRGDGTDPLVAHCLDTNCGDYSRAETFNAVPIAFSCKDYGNDVQSNVTPTMRSMNSANGRQNGGGQLAVLTPGLSVDQACGNMTVPVSVSESQSGHIRETETTQALGCTGGKPGQGYQAIRSANAVRRLTPRECERLQGFPDDYTLIDYSKRASADKIAQDVMKYYERTGYSGQELERVALCPDGPRYKALGNSMAVPVMRWIGERIQEVQDILKETDITQ